MTEQLQIYHSAAQRRFLKKRAEKGRAPQDDLAVGPDETAILAATDEVLADIDETLKGGSGGGTDPEFEEGRGPDDPEAELSPPAKAA